MCSRWRPKAGCSGKHGRLQYYLRGTAHGSHRGGQLRHVAEGHVCGGDLGHKANSDLARRDLPVFRAAIEQLRADVMENPLDAALQRLTDIQRRAVDWESGDLLVLAGPGSDKTEVLTCRIARLLNSSPDRRFRILALTFTNKAANEMLARVAALVPTMVGRANIGTFHAFCTQALRQHGVHLGIKPTLPSIRRLRTGSRRSPVPEGLPPLADRRVPGHQQRSICAIAENGRRRVSQRCRCSR